MTLIAAGIENPNDYKWLEGPFHSHPNTAAFMIADTLSVTEEKRPFTRRRRKIHRLVGHVRVPYEYDRPRSRAEKKARSEIVVGTAGHGLLGNSVILEFSEALDQIYLLPELATSEFKWHLGLDHAGAFPAELSWEPDAVPEASFDMEFAVELLKTVAERTLHEAMELDALDRGPKPSYSSMFVDFLLLGLCGKQNRVRLFKLHCVEYPGEGSPPEFQITEIQAGTLAMIGHQPAREWFELRASERTKKDWLSRHSFENFENLLKSGEFSAVVGGSAYYVIHDGEKVRTSVFDVKQ